jgi:hypothetical protein
MAGRGNVTASTREAIQLVNVEMTVDDFVKWQKFKRMNLNKNSSMDAPPISASATSASSCGNVSKVVSNDQSVVPWLIDSGASRHMAGSYREFSKYDPDVKGHDVKLADGSTRAVTGTGVVVCGSNMSLSSVLHVPSFPINLLSISCITKELNCVAIFYPKWCLFLEIGTRRELGRGSMHDGLYYLDNDISPMVAAALSYSPLGEVLLLHHRLGHMPFGTIGQLYPGLLNKIRRSWCVMLANMANKLEVRMCCPIIAVVCPLRLFTQMCGVLVEFHL